jgi:type IV pilus assembly protein PilF
MKQKVVAQRYLERAGLMAVVCFALAACVSVDEQGPSGWRAAGRGSDTVVGAPIAGKPSDLAGAPGEETEARRRAKIRLELATGFYQQGQHGQALEELRRALAADGSFAQAYGMLGLVYMAINERVKADESFQRALNLTPTDSEILNNYGWFLCQSGRVREALSRFDAAARDPLYVTPARPLHNAGICLLREGDSAAAEPYFLKSFQVDPRNAVAMYQLGELYLKRGDLERARFHAQRLLSTHPPSSETVWLALRVEHKAGDDGAVAVLSRQLRREFPSAPEAQLLERGDFGE